jgi:prepilin-type N-terminal cleavage/methylation domain-containing protein
MNSTHRHRDGGFTLVELIVTISILTVLAGILIPSVNMYIDKGNSSKASADLRELANVMNKYKVDNGIWATPTDASYIPSTNYYLTGYPCFFNNTAGRPGWDGPYLNEGVMVDGVMHVASWDAVAKTGEGLVDPWGNRYRVYTFANNYNSTTGAIVLSSAGQNGVFNTSTANLFAVKATSDDILQLVTYNVK